MELYISDHPLDCLTCAANGDCELQDMAGAVGLRDVRYGYDGENHTKQEKDESNPYFTFDASKCIVCSRCVRACEEVQGTFALTIQGRGFDSKVSPGASLDNFLSSECVSCGACVQACPTATLSEKSLIEIGQPEHSVVTTCAYCGVGCSFKAEMRGEELVRMVPYKDGKANRGHSCVKGRFAWGYANHKERILNPMIRESIDQPWREVSWDEAIGRVASEFKRLQEKHGRLAIGGITSSRCTNEETYLVQKLIRGGFGNNNVDTCARVCHSPTGFGLSQAFGTSAGTQDFDSVEQTDVVLIIGANPTDAHPVFASRMKKRLRAGARLIVVDPRRTDIVRTPHVEADYHLPLRPGTNAAILNALAHTIVTEGLTNEAFVREFCDRDAFEHWAAFVSEPQNSPETVGLMAGVSPEDIRGAARLYATGGNGAIYYGLGVTEHSQGTTTVMAIANLAMVTGNLGRKGVGVNRCADRTTSRAPATWAPSRTSSPVTAISPTTPRATCSPSCGAVRSTMSLACASQHVRRRDRGDLQGHLRAGRGHPPVRSQHRPCREGAVVDGMRRGAGPVPERDGQLRARLPAGLDLPRKGRHLHQRRAPHQPRAQGDDAQERLGGLGDHPQDLPCHGLRHELRPSVGDHGRDRRRLGPVACATRRHRSARRSCHIGGFVRGKGNFLITEYIPTDERTGPRFPLLLTTGRILSQYNVGAQTRRTDKVVWHEQDVLGSILTTPSSAACATATGSSSTAGPAAPRCAPRSPTAWRRAVVYTTFHHPETPGQCDHHRLFGLGDQLPRIQGDGGADLALERPQRMAARV